MSTNEILILVIVILGSIIIVVGTYFLANFLLNLKRKKKIDNVFDPSNLVEEESLMNVMDDKKNVEYKPKGADVERFVKSNDEVKLVTNGLTQEEKINPFEVDMTMRTKDNVKYEIPDPENTNKFIK